MLLGAKFPFWKIIISAKANKIKAKGNKGTNAILKATQYSPNQTNPQDIILQTIMQIGKEINKKNNAQVYLLLEALGASNNMGEKAAIIIAGNMPSSVNMSKRITQNFIRILICG